MEILGIDIGGTGMKAAIVNIEKGVLITDRHRVDTPKGGQPDDMMDVLKSIKSHFGYSGPIGCGFPAVVKNGQVCTAANINDSWIGLDINKVFSKALHDKVYVLNDVDAAGIAEMTFGAGKKNKGMVVVTAFGTGIGTALFNKGVLFPNSELGHLYFEDGLEAEKYTSNSARKKYNLKDKQFSHRVTRYFQLLENLFWPELFVMGGGISKKWDRFGKDISLKTPVVPAKFFNSAGIIGAAIYASTKKK